jgi:SSS family solute:Na+ symporter
VQLPVVLALLAYAAALLIVAWRGRWGGDTLDYLLAGRRLTTPAFVATLVATWYGGVLGVGEFSYRFGISNWLVFGVPYYLAAILFAFWLARPARSGAALSLPDQLRAAYGPAAGRVGAGLVLVMTIPAAYVLMLGELGGIYLGVPVGPATIGAAAFVVLYLVTGGFRSVVRTNILQFFLMFAAFGLVLPAALTRLGGLSDLWHSLPPSHRSWDGGMGYQYIVVWYFIALQTLVEPTFYQRCYAARTPAVARNGILVSVAFWLAFDALTTLSGLAARALLPDLADPVLAYPALGSLVLPPVANAFFAVGLVATVMSTAHSYLFLAASTIGHDIVPDLVAGADQRRWAMGGLVLSAVAAVVVALALRSVVQIWHDVGSIVTSALLLPVALAHAPVRMRFGAAAAILCMAATTAMALLWIAARSPSGYPLGLEPIFPALAVSLTVWIIDRARPRRPGMEL